MPACSSDIFSSGTGYRSSSPPNSRSNSASPPLSISPSHDQSTGTFKRSISNLSSSSFSHKKIILCDNHNEKSAGGTLGIHENPAFPVPEPCHHHYHRHHRNRHRATERESDDDRLSSARRVIYPTKASFEQIKSSAATGWFLPARIIAWYVNIVFHVLHRLNETLSNVLWAPVIWISAWICVFWVIIQLPLNSIKWLIRAIYTPSFELSRSNKRCVLITGGSTIQALHLARNFYKAGARVVVCEIDGLFGLARFSTACSRFYNVPRPGPGTAAEYVNALKTIVERERVLYFIPVSCTSCAYYDALAKPHLEIAGCECFVPGASDVTSLEDPLQLIRRSSSLGLSIPNHRLVKSLDDLFGLYENGYFTINDRYIMVSTGPTGMTERTKLHLPAASIDNGVPSNLREKLETHEISERRPWIVIREQPPAGSSMDHHQLVTCTTVKDSRVVANVTCRLDDIRGLVPEERNDVNNWLEIFFRGLFAKRINGHMSFKLAYNLDHDSSQITLVPISCRVGVPLPYLCLTSVHPRLVWRPCRHFSRQNSANLIVNEKYKRTSPMKHPSATTDRLFTPRSSSTILREHDKSSTRSDDNGTHFTIPSSPVLDKRDALFVYWDPLPYCAYYHLQFPLRRLAGVIRERPAQHKPPLAVVQ